MYHFVAKWEDSNEFAVVKSDKIADGRLRSRQYTTLIGHKVQIKWGRQEYLVTVIGAGTKAEMNELFERSIEEALENTRIAESQNFDANIQGKGASVLLKTSRKCRQETKDVKIAKKYETKREKTKATAVREAKRLRTVLETAARTEPVLPSSDHELQLVPLDRPIDRNADGADALEIDGNWIELDDLRAEVKKLKEGQKKLEEKKQKYKNKVKALKASNRKLETKLNSKNEETVELVEGSGVFLDKDELESLKLMSNTPCVLARNLFRSLMPIDDLIGRSLFGKKCNANVGEALPAVNARVRDAIISFAIEAFNIRQNNCRIRGLPYRSAKRQVIASLSKYLNEVNKKERDN